MGEGAGLRGRGTAAGRRRRRVLELRTPRSSTRDVGPVRAGRGGRRLGPGAARPVPVPEHGSGPAGHSGRLGHLAGRAGVHYPQQRGLGRGVRPGGTSVAEAAAAVAETTARCTGRCCPAAVTKEPPTAAPRNLGGWTCTTTATARPARAARLRRQRVRGPAPPWLEAALTERSPPRRRIQDGAARAAVAVRHGRGRRRRAATAGAAEAFTLVARLRAWRRPVVVHSQVHRAEAALEAAGHTRRVALPGRARLPARGPSRARRRRPHGGRQPGKPTGYAIPRRDPERSTREGRLVVVDEAFLDAGPSSRECAGEPGWSCCAASPSTGRSPASARANSSASQGSSRNWRRAGPVVGVGAGDRRHGRDRGRGGGGRGRAKELTGWREHLEAGLRDRGLAFPCRGAVRPCEGGPGVHAALREQGVAVRRGGTFPGLDDSWVRIAARPPEQTGRPLEALDKVRAEPRA